MTERWRLFVAVPIGERLRADLSAAVDGWRDRPDLAGLRWTDPHSWHITLAFLGAVDAYMVDGLSAGMEAVRSRHGPMQLRTGGLGAFPSARRARVAWYGIADPDGALARLALDLRSDLVPDAVGDFHPHVTLARARRGPVDLRDWATASSPEGDLAADRIQLMRSHIGRGPARYEQLADAGLGVAAHV